MMDIDLTKIETEDLIEELESRDVDLETTCKACEEREELPFQEIWDMGYDDEEVVEEFARRGLKTLTQPQVDALWIAYQSRRIELLEGWVKQVLGIDKQTPNAFVESTRKAA